MAEAGNDEVDHRQLMEDAQLIKKLDKFQTMNVLKSLGKVQRLNLLRLVSNNVSVKTIKRGDT